MTLSLIFRFFILLKILKQSLHEKILNPLSGAKKNPILTILRQEEKERKNFRSSDSHRDTLSQVNEFSNHFNLFLPSRQFFLSFYFSFFLSAFFSFSLSVRIHSNFFSPVLKLQFAGSKLLSFVILLPWNSFFLFFLFHSFFLSLSIFSFLNFLHRQICSILFRLSNEQFRVGEKERRAEKRRRGEEE